jgi:CBS domain-containing protein
MRRPKIERVRDFWKRFLTAETIAEPIECATFGESVEQVVRTMDKNRFNVLGVKNHEGHICGYAQRNEMKGETIEDCVKAIEPEHLLSIETPLKDCISPTVKQKWLFVTDSKGVDVEGIITIADLHKQPVRMLLFSAISMLEMAMLEIIKNKKYFPDEKSWGITSGRLTKAKGLFSEREKANQQIDLPQCLDFCDKYGILIEKEMWSELGFLSKKEATNVFKKLRKLRNNLAHSHEKIWSNIDQIVELHDKAETVLEKCLAFNFKES